MEGHVTFRTLAVIVSRLINTFTDVTNVGRLLTLVDVNTHEPSFVQPEAFVARAHEAAEGVGAVAVVADVFVLLALIYVF